MPTLAPSLLKELDIKSALRAEIGWHPDLVPDAMINSYAVENFDTVLGYITELSKGNIVFGAADVVAADKWQHARRPVAFLPLAARVLYRAVVSLMRDHLPELNHRNTQYREMQDGPLNAKGITHVVMTDIANYYGSIPTHQLSRELIQRTGRWEPNEWLREFWTEISKGQNGLPQVSQPSDIVADAYADELHRRLLRRNVRSWRYSDDFRMVAKGRNSALSILEMFDEEARTLGLAVNERKTKIVELESYGKIISSASRRLQEISESARATLTEFDPYTERVIEPEEAEVQQAAAAEVVQYWAAHRGGSLDVGDQIELANLLDRALMLLGTVRNASAVPFCTDILQLDPQVTPQVIKYLIEMSKEDPDEIKHRLHCIVQSVPLSRWQRLWALYAYSQESLASFDSGPREWMASNLSDSSEVVRSTAAWALAMSRSLKISDWCRLAETATSLGRPWLAASLAADLGWTEKERVTAVSGDRLDRDIYRWVSECDPFIVPF
jgi:reverse transcriptase-like protein